jgi:pimeloyl-ACP methyl ester carboxylesterase
MNYGDIADNDYSTLEGYVTNTHRQKLAYTYTSPTKKPDGLVVILHPQKSAGRYGSTSVDISDLALQLNFATLRFDFRGHGASYDAPHWEKYGVMDWVEDIDTIVNLVVSNQLPGSHNIVLVGISFSSDPALIYTSDHSEISRVICFSPGTGKSSSGTKDNGSRSKWWDSAHHITQIKYDEFVKKISMITQKVDLIHSQSDESVPIEQSEEIIELIGNNATLHRLKSGAHHYMDPPEALKVRQKILTDILNEL